VPWGKPPNTIGSAITQVTSGSGHVFAGEIATRYPWRLMPYVQDVWELVYYHRDPPARPAFGDSAPVAEAKAYDLSLTPSFGLNSVFVGGHRGPYDGFDANGLPVRDGPVVFFEDQVRRTSDLVVFTEVWGTYNDDFLDELFGFSTDGGSFWSTAPLIDGARWEVVDGKPEPARASNIVGVPRGRYSPAVPSAYFDGHVAAEQPETLTDMRRWYNDATGPTDDPLD